MQEAFIVSLLNYVQFFVKFYNLSTLETLLWRLRRNLAPDGRGGCGGFKYTY